jgi:thiamine biosynthesis lipoprotein
VNSLRQCRPLLGTYVEIHLAADEDDDCLLDRSLAAFEEISRIQRLMSFHDPESELSRINASAHLAEIPVSPDMRRVLSFAMALAEASGGAFDPTIAPALVRRGVLPDHGSCPENPADWRSIHLGDESVRFDQALRLDLGGIAKGYAVDLALAVIGDDVEATVNAGGDLAMTHWRGRDVEIRTPASDGRATLSVPMENRALATSAAYYLESEHVILHPGNLKPLERKDSASVFASSCMAADALTKVVLLLPDPAPVLRRFDAQGLVIDLEGTIVRL